MNNLLRGRFCNNGLLTGPTAPLNPISLVYFEEVQNIVASLKSRPWAWSRADDHAVSGSIVATAKTKINFVFAVVSLLPTVFPEMPAGASKKTLLFHQRRGPRQLCTPFQKGIKRKNAF